ncbi:hypothetical protein ABMC89_15540 [Sulfitobacter sp. HNIBRBA3233]|uniref:hypothetical protein n=1 Tax=Sulfitobacter marinivivus TaxID=3158558 RepID=UPI0032DF5C0C
MRVAGKFLLASAALHILGAFLSGWSDVGIFLLFPALLYTAFYVGLRRGLGWVAWIALLCMLGGMGGTLLELLGVSSVPDWILWGILAADFGAAVFLVRAISAGRAS